MSLFCAVVSASGQQPPAAAPAPIGVFGGTRVNPDAKEQLNVTVSVVEGYDQDVPTAVLGSIDAFSPQTGGFTTMLSATTGFSHRTPHSEFAVNAASNLRHYAELGETHSVGHSAGVGFSVGLTARDSLYVNQSAAYTPNSWSGLFPTGVEAQVGDHGGRPADFTVNGLESYVYTSDLAYTHTLNRRTSLSGSGMFQYTDRRKESDLWRDVTSRNLQVELSRGVSRNMSLTVGSSLREGAIGYVDTDQTKELALNIGMEYRRRMSATREARYTVRLGPAAADVPHTSEGPATVRRRYHVDNELGVSYPITRTWQVQGNYRRRVEYEADLPEPVLANSGSVSAIGFLNRRLDVSVSAAYSSGQSLENQSTLQFDTYAADMKVRYAIRRTLATYVEYLYYFYDFRGTNRLVPTVPPQLERNGIRIGLTMWVPMLQR